MKNLILDIQKRLGEAEMPAGYTRLRKNNRLFEYVDLDWGQVDFYTQFPPPVKFPCCLIELLSAAYSNEGNLIQIGDIAIQLRIVDMVLNNSSYRAPDKQKEVAFAIFDLIDETNRLLHGWGQALNTESDKGGYGKLIKQSISKINRRDGLREYRLLYSVQLTDTSAALINNRTATAPKITVSVK